MAFEDYMGIIAMRDCPVWIDNENTPMEELESRAKAIEMQTDRYKEIKMAFKETQQDYKIHTVREPSFGVPFFSSSFTMLDILQRRMELSLHSPECDSPEAFEIAEEAFQKYMGGSSPLKLVVSYTPS